MTLFARSPLPKRRIRAQTMSKMAPPVNAPSSGYARTSRRAGGLLPSRSAPLTLNWIAPIPRGLVQSFYARGRRGGFAAPAAAAPGLCCGPRYAAIWHANAHQLTTPRGPRDEALRTSGAPTQRSEKKLQVGVGCVDLIPNTFLATRSSATAPRRLGLPYKAVGPLVAQASRLRVRPGRPHHKTTRMHMPFVVHASRVQGGKFEIRNSKFPKVGRN